jgi:hypothetical protein
MSRGRATKAGRGRARSLAVSAALAVALVPLWAGVAGADNDVTPKAVCGPGALQETGIQGRVPTSDYDSKRTALGYQCNAEQVGHEGTSGGFRTYRYIDGDGHECAYYDTTLLVGTSVLIGTNAGVAVLDMTDPTHPLRTATLATPAMLSPHESLNLNQRRGLLAAIVGSPATAPGIVDIYDVSADCRHPVLKFSGPIGGAGHEATFAPDGNTLYTTATALPYVTALDVTDPAVPVPVWISTRFRFHGMNVSDDGTRLYAADLGNAGLTILDVSQIQHRTKNPKTPVVSHITWDNVSIPQTNLPITIGGHPYLVEIDEYSRGTSTNPTAPVGAGRIIDIADETKPVVVSQLRLEVNDAANRAGPEKDDPGAGDPAQGYAGHYCAVPQRSDPGIVACSFIVSGLRVFDIHDPQHPKEIAYFNPPSRDVVDLPSTTSAASAVPALSVCRLAVLATGPSPAAANPPSPPDVFSSFPQAPFYGNTLTHWAMSAPTFVPDRHEVWYSDGMYGFYAVRLTNSVWTPTTPAAPGEPGEPAGGGTAAEAATPRAAGAGAAAAVTGWTDPTLLVLALLGVALGGSRLAAATRQP